MKTFANNGLRFIWTDCRCGKLVPAALKGKTHFGCPYCVGQGNPRALIVILRGEEPPASEWDELDPTDN